ncbi:hypothetical protein C8R47DRAFT_1074337 [Mycena vitilis]|nr:hypothetical protein C8R47DRAFT_1074337 [Mycena vitilis]
MAGAPRARTRQCPNKRGRLRMGGGAQSGCLAVYSAAVKLGWRDVAVVAAKESLKQPLRSLNKEESPWLNGMTAVAYHRLLHYHFLCGQAARGPAQDLTWVARVFTSCSTCAPPGPNTYPTGWASTSPPSGLRWLKPREPTSAKVSLLKSL